jgi:hypothetical protein
MLYKCHPPFSGSKIHGFLNRINVIKIIAIENKRKSDLIHNKDEQFSQKKKRWTAPWFIWTSHALRSKHMLAHKSNVNRSFRR